MPLTPEQRKRYSRNIALTQIGIQGQELLLDSSVLVVGAGGLGNPVLSYLAASGIGKIGIAESDRIELSNLQRQTLYKTEDVGHKKIDISAEYIKKTNQDVTIKTHAKRIDEDNCDEIIKQYDIIADCTDNFDTRFVLNKACYKLNKTLVSAAASGFSGQLSTYKAYLGDNHPCFECFCPADPGNSALPACMDGGILGSITGIMGSLQATEIIKELLGLESLSGHIIIYDGIKSLFRKVKLNKVSKCNVCGN